MNQIHDAMRISFYLNLCKEVVEDHAEDILADTILAQSVDDSPEATE
jgi:hypothetical protein